MKPAVYTLIMKSGRTFLMEEFISHPMHQSQNNQTGKINKGVLVKELSVTGNNDVYKTNDKEYKNICFITHTTQAIKYIDTIDALGLERMENETIKYIDI